MRIPYRNALFICFGTNWQFRSLEFAQRLLWSEGRAILKVGIIGGGRVGSRLAACLHEAGVLAGITAATAQHSAQLAQQFGVPATDNATLWQAADVLLLTVPDRLIGAVAEELAQSVTPAAKVVLHVSGSVGLEPLAPLAQLGAYVGSLHPLQSFAGGNTQLAGVYMALDGDSEAQDAGKKLVELFGGKAFSVPAEERAAYHAAACICSNYVVAVEAMAAQLMARWTGSNEAAWEALLPLFKGTAANLQATQNPAAVLTGPIARGDVSTVAKHLAALPADVIPAYCSLGLATTSLALANGTIDENAADELRNLLGGYYG